MHLIELLSPKKTLLRLLLEVRIPLFGSATLEREVVNW